jgi:hypothetical protein
MVVWNFIIVNISTNKVKFSYWQPYNFSRIHKLFRDTYGQCFFVFLFPPPLCLHKLAKWSKYTHIHRECAMHFVTSNEQRDLARQQGTTSHCTDICGYWGVRLGSSMSSLHFGQWTWPRLVPRITQGASTVYRNDLAIQEVVCTWLQNSEMDMGHRSTVNLVQLGVEIPDSFWNSIMNARKGTINKYIHTFLTQWKINCNLQNWKWAFRLTIFTTFAASALLDSLRNGGHYTLQQVVRMASVPCQFAF